MPNIVQQRLVVRKLARALQDTFQIREGCELGYLLGIYEGDTNTEVLVQWVGQALRDPNEEMGCTVLPALVDRLEETLRREEILPW